MRANDLHTSAMTFSAYFRTRFGYSCDNGISCHIFFVHAREWRERETKKRGDSQRNVTYMLQVADNADERFIDDLECLLNVIVGKF